MKNRLFIAFVLIFVAAIFLGASMVSAGTTNGADDSISTPSGSANGSDDVASAATGAVSNGADDNAGGSAATNGDDDTSGPENKSQSDSSNNSNSTSHGSSRKAVSTSTPSVVLASSSCPLITSYMKIGWQNDPSQVRALQAFLKNVEKLDVQVSGIFDEETESAVKAFQQKYLNLILGPWNATKPSGVVYITTAKVINKIACSSNLNLSADEMKIIASYGGENAGYDGSIEIGTSSNQEIGAATGSLDVTLASVENTAASNNSSLAKKFWNFVVGLFK